MRIQGGNVDLHRTLEDNSAPLPSVAPPPARPQPQPQPQPAPIQSRAPEPEPTFLDQLAGAFEGIADAIRGVGRSLADALVGPSRAVEQLAGSILLVGGKALSALQSLLCLEAGGRRLNDAERLLAQEVFGSSLSLDTIRIKSGRAGLYTLFESERPFVLGNTIYTKGAGPLSPADLIHELMHVFQYQQRGAGYLSKAVVAQVVDGSEQAYDFASHVARGTSFTQLGPELQAELIAVAYEQGAISSGRVVRPFVVVHEGKALDCTPQLREALAELNAEKP